MESCDLFQIPDACPTCGQGVTEQGDFLYCRNKACPAQLRGSLLVWVRNLGLLNWGDALIDNLTDPNNNWINDLSDLYHLTIDDLAQCCSGEKMAEKCHHALHSNKDIPLELLLGSMNIPNFGLSTATDLVQAGYDTVDKVLSMTLENLQSVPNVGEKTAQSIFAGLQEKGPQIRALNAVLNVKLPVKGFLTGKSFCITGELSQPRKLVEKMILDAGGVVKSSVGKTTTYLVTNDTSSGSSKLKNAAKYGTQVINEESLYVLLKNPAR